MSQPSASSGTALSRRSFVTGTVSTVAAMPLIGSSAQAEEPGRRVAQLRQPIVTSLQINKQRYELSLDPRTSLLDALRDHAELTGTKKGCDHGQCGACTVLVDGKRVLSCLSFAWMNDSKQITTVEGLASTEGELHPMQQAFIDHDAFQCGYCTPGQIMSAIGLLGEGHAGSRAEIREQMSGNICRCGAYVNIVAAVEDAAAAMEEG
jgi:xanthine dehydrogenase YagT iron-sulfur-binding subunit